MFKRFGLHVALIFIFAFAQIGLATHAINHFGEVTKHSQEDKSNHKNHCAQCLVYADVAGGLQSQSFQFYFAPALFSTSAFHQSKFSSHTYAVYAARAPPTTLI